MKYYDLEKDFDTIHKKGVDYYRLKNMDCGEEFCLEVEDREKKYPHDLFLNEEKYRIKLVCRFCSNRKFLKAEDLADREFACTLPNTIRFIKEK